MKSYFIVIQKNTFNYNTYLKKDLEKSTKASEGMHLFQ